MLTGIYYELSRPNTPSYIALDQGMWFVFNTDLDFFHEISLLFVKVFRSHTEGLKMPCISPTRCKQGCDWVASKDAAKSNEVQQMDLAECSGQKDISLVGAIDKYEVLRNLYM